MQRSRFTTARKFWFQHNEAALNWVALGMLLAAWNACDNAPPESRRADEQAMPPRPAALSSYTFVSVRAYKGHETVNEL